MSNTSGYKVGTKGQMVVAKAARDLLGVKPGCIALQRVVDGHLDLYFMPPPHRRSLAGSLAQYVTDENRIPPERWNEAREQAWADAIRERYEDRGHP